MIGRYALAALILALAGCDPGHGARPYSNYPRPAASLPAQSQPQPSGSLPR
jgi:hypothetical protein